MKKSILLVVLATSTLFSCQKEKTESQLAPSPAAARVPVQFGVTGFISKVENMPAPGGRQASPQSRDEQLGTKVSHIVYAAYTTGTFQLVSHIRQSVNANTTTFGTIRDTLPEGTYRIVMMASQDSMIYNESAHDLKQPTLNYEFELKPMGDAFYKSFEYTVTAGGTNTIEDLTLTRAVGHLEVNILDGEALEASNYDVNVKAWTVNTDFDVMDGFSETNYDENYVELPRISAKKYTCNLFEKPGIRLRIEVTNRATQELVVRKTIENVTIGINKRTIVTGNLTGMGNSTTGNWDVLLNQTWGQDVIVEF